MRKEGFTVIELIVVILFLAIAGGLGFYQLNRLSVQQTNSEEKTAINAIYYSLEEGIYPKNGYYPEAIKDDTLATMDPSLLTDPFGVKIGEANSLYRYEPTNCQDGKCKSYKLRAILTDEADFVKESKNK